MKSKSRLFCYLSLLIFVLSFAVNASGYDKSTAKAVEIGSGVGSAMAMIHWMDYRMLERAERCVTNVTDLQNIRDARFDLALATAAQTVSSFWGFGTYVHARLTHRPQFSKFHFLLPAIATFLSSHANSKLAELSPETKELLPMRHQRDWAKTGFDFASYACFQVVTLLL